jgi:hypothetical protein
MPLNTELANKVWSRYFWCRDNGHAKFVEKADICERFFAGDQWDAADRAKLKLQRRPALTINKIISTLTNVMGEQIYNRNEISFRPRSGSPSEVADALTKVFKHISDNNQLPWKRSDMFADGVIRSRGFLDVRLDFTDSMQGEVRIDNLNSKNCIIDPDAEQYDPDTWNEVFVTKWLTADDIAILYNKEDAEALRNKGVSITPYGYDSIQVFRDRFAEQLNPQYASGYDDSSVQRSIRVIERQHRVLDKQLHFYSPETGDMRPIPKDFSRDKIAWFVKSFGFAVIPKLVKRIRWTVVADNYVLHDEFSPYKHFTPVPYFPLFRYGNTIGLVENLTGPQELLNKVSSQELHVVNTTANSGWKVKAGALTNMSIEELEQRGAETGLVIETNGDPDKDIVRITPNQVPSGLDRISYKSEEHIKTISGVSDSAQGFDREDVAAKAIQQKRKAASTNFAKPMDSLARSDYILARNVLDLVQEFYTEPRLLTITKDRVTGENETVEINQPTPEGTIANDLMLGEYDVVIVGVPERETLEDSQFEQALAMREAGIGISDKTLILASRLIDKKEILADMDAQSNSPEAVKQRQLALEAQAAEVAKTQAETLNKHADTRLREAKTGKETVTAQKDAMTPPEDNGLEVKMMTAQADMALENQKFEHQKQLDYAELNHKMQLEKQAARQDAQLKAEQAATERALRVTQAAQAASNPQPTSSPKQGA